MTTAKNLMAKLSFITRVSKMGDKRIIVIPKFYHDKIPKARQLRVVIDDEI
jgi:hypothetical protein